MNVHDLPTPAVIIDLPRLRRNIESMARYAAGHGLAMRPHTKTHKMPEVARMQLAAGAVGLTVAKMGEAEVMAPVSPHNLLIAYPMVGADRVRRLIGLAGTTAVSVGLDDELALRPIAEAASAAGVEIPILVQVNIGMGREGLDTPCRVVDLAALADRLPGVRFEGLQTYIGHVSATGDGLVAEMERIDARQKAILEALRQAGLRAAVVSGGSTPTARHSHHVTSLTELRLGTYVFYDAMQLIWGCCQLDDCALTVEMTVVSTAVPDQMLLDGGSKTLALDAITDDPRGLGVVLDAPAARIRALNEEHAMVDLRECPRRFRVGDRVRVLPVHACGCVNMHDRVWVADGDRVLDQWTVAGRGRVV